MLKKKNIFQGNIFIIASTDALHPLNVFVRKENAFFIENIFREKNQNSSILC
jgi:hypothetical protein